MKKDATRQRFMLAGQLILAANGSQSASTGSNVGSTNDDIALARIAAGVFVVNPEAGSVHTADGQAADRPGRNGYRELDLRHDGRKSPSHRVVWLAAFGPIPPGRWEINHRNRKRDDNRIRNLELVLPTGNTAHWMGRTDYLRVGLDDEGAVDPRRLNELLDGLKSQETGRRSRVVTGPNASGVAMHTYRQPRRFPPRTQ